MKAAVLGRGLGQRFGHAEVLRGVDVEVAAGERLAVLGDNGAGKTTLLRILATLDRPAAGSLELFGLDVRTRRTALRPRIGWVGHNPGLYPALTARENLVFFCDLYGLAHSPADAALARLGLEAEAGRRAGELSRGKQQRLALARSLLHDPELWIVDEPDASLDAAGRALLGRLAEGRTLVVATHDRGLAARLCGRALELREGAVDQRPPLSVVEDPG
ncbi:MAG TPA: heme ABC exporter ATP-binding protein CcmA [Candidatus Dormibacteraeota bacterium]